MQFNGSVVTHTDGSLNKTSINPTESNILTSAESNLFGGDVLSAIVLASALTLLLIVLLGIFIAYKQREEPHRDTGQENEHVPEGFQTANDRSKELKTIQSITPQHPSHELNTQEIGIYWRELLSTMEPGQDSDSAIYERVISFQNDLLDYEVLNQNSMIHNPYETLQKCQT
ncbi:hypothetical protein XELAEV_18037667mg [Xenopus laevis]|uniref:Uncharacterized protein n=1 Tax=Xenopus laevis TaxID=8355 RepID=A0A974HAD6_XENLA|nr:hypothetical protein XELAEV_18037667mg [Xenopus laevis]